MSGLVVAAAQSKSVRGDIEANVQGHLRILEKAAENEVDLIIFPELSLTGYEPDLAETHHLLPSDPRLNPFQDFADNNSMHILVGAPYKEDRKTHIAAFLYPPYNPPKVYTKHFLHSGEEKHFSPGKNELTFPLKGEKIFTAICADIAHSEHAARAAYVGSTVFAAGVLITPGGYDADAELLEGYAVKHGMTVVMANFASASGGWQSGGKSAVWAPNGEIVAVAPSSGEAIVVCRMDPDGFTGSIISID